LGGRGRGEEKKSFWEEDWRSEGEGRRRQKKWLRATNREKKEEMSITLVGMEKDK